MQDLDGSGLPHEADDRAARVSEREQAQRQHPLAEEPMYCDEPDIYAADLKGALDLIDGSTPFFAQYLRIEGPDRDQLFREQYRDHWQGPTGETRVR